MTRTSSYADFTSEFLKGFAIAKQALARGDNMINTLRTETDLSQQHCIEIAYALQSGSYSAQKNDEISRQ